MRRGIGLRAYSQRDPLNEFKVEAYRMFDELKDTIRHDVTHTILRASVAAAPIQRPARATALGRPRRPSPCGRGRRSAATTRAGADRGKSTSAATAPSA